MTIASMAAVMTTVASSNPLTGVLNTWRYTTLGLKKRGGGANRVALPNRSVTSSGSATDTATADTIFAVVLVGAIRRKRNRSRTQPSAGASTTTETTKARPTGTPSPVRTVYTNADT